MTTIPELIEIEKSINACLKNIKEAENESIRAVLKFFGIPEKKQEDEPICIEELLKNDRIYILLHPEVYHKIDFTQFILPKKLIIDSCSYVEKGLIYGENDIHYYHPGTMQLSKIEPATEKYMTFFPQGIQFKTH